MEWHAHKQQLIKRHRLHDVFASSADENARLALIEARRDPSLAPDRYEPLLFDSWLHDVANLVDRVLA